jgi:hypothetical protein
MDRVNKPEAKTMSSEKLNAEQNVKIHAPSITTSQSFMLQGQESNFDWSALGIVLLISAFFAVTARIHAQPATSFVPTVVLSATGCGLLVTAIRKLHMSKNIGLLEAALGGFFMAVLQFIVALTYPGIIETISIGQILRDDFLITWLLISGFSIIFSLAGATLGHLSFAPIYPLSVVTSSTARVDEKDFHSIQEEQTVDNTEVQKTSVNTVPRNEVKANTVQTSDQENRFEEILEISASNQSPRTIISYIIIILLLGLAPTVIAYLFSAAYDFILSFNQFVPGPYPSLRILSALLPWQIPLPIDLSSNIRNIIVFSLLWRIPLFLGNPSVFDLQAIEPYLYNGAAFALLFLTTKRRNIKIADQSSQKGIVAFLCMEAALGLILVLPANIWVSRGLEGLLQIHGTVIPIRTISILNPLTFSLNLITGPLVCVGLGIMLRILLSKRRV